MTVAMYHGKNSEKVCTPLESSVSRSGNYLTPDRTGGANYPSILDFGELTGRLVRAILYMHARHPNFVQLYGTVSSGGLHATIFHDGSQFLAVSSPTVEQSLSELVPVEQYLEEFRQSPISTVYLYGYFVRCLSSLGKLVVDFFPESRGRGIP